MTGTVRGATGYDTNAAAGRGGARLLWATLQPFRRRIVAGIAVGVLWSGAKLAVPMLVRDAIDRGIAPRDLGHLSGTVALILLVGGTGAVLAGLRRYLAQSAAYQVETALRARLFAHVLHLDAAYHARTPAGQLVARATSDLQQIQQPFVNIPLTASNGVMFVGASAILVSLDPWLALWAMGPILGLFVLARRFNAVLGPRAADLQRDVARFAGLVTDAIAGIRAVKGLGLERAELARAADQAGRVRDAGLALNGVRATYLPLIDLLPALGVAAVLWIGGAHVAAGTMTVGGLIQFNYYVLMLVGPLRHTGITIAQFQRAFVSAGLIDATLAIAPAIAEAPELPLLEAEDRSGEIRFEGVDFAYRDGPALFSALDFTIAEGETVAIVGAAGSGKTSLAGLIPRLHDVHAGRVLVGGRDVREMGLAELRASVGMVFEDAFLFSGTVRENIAFARPDASLAEIEAAARAAGADGFISALEGGYDAPIGERGHSLSGGQRQRIALARALVTDPGILVLDAATSAVDAAKEAEICEALAGVLGRRTTILIAHRPSTLRLADRVLLLDQGRIAAAGRHDDLLGSSHAYRRVLAVANAGDDTGAARTAA
jgi:ATP-binding cassette, subfamily B, bacterial